MSTNHLPSERLKILRNNIRGAVHGGLHLSSEDTAAFAQELTTILELMSEVEDENRVLGHAVKTASTDLRNQKRAAAVVEIACRPNSNVALFPCRQPPQPWPGNGGDAA